MELYDKLYEIRKEKGLSQEDVAEKLDISRQSISRWETGRAKPSTENLISLCKIYGVSPNTFLDGETEDSDSETEAPRETGNFGEVSSAPDQVSLATDDDARRVSPLTVIIKKRVLAGLAVACAVFFIAAVVLTVCLVRAGKEETLDIEDMEEMDDEEVDSFGKIEFEIH